MKASDLQSTSRILLKIVAFCKEKGDWSELNEQVHSLSRKHGQLKQATTKMVQTVMEFLDETPDMETKLKTIETLRTVTEGKIFVEVERARVTRLLSKIKESQNDIKEAADVLTELQVETYGSMDRREKTDIILEQVRLSIANSEFVQANVLSRKISTKFLEADENTDLKLRFYELKIRLALEEENWLECCKHYFAVLETKSIKEDDDRWRDVLQNMVYFIILSPYDNAQSDLLHRIAANERLPRMPLHHELLKCFTQNELMRWPRIQEIYGEALRATPVFAAGDLKSEKRWDELRKRVIEHVRYLCFPVLISKNIRVIAKYYTRIRTQRLTQLLDLTEKESETYLSHLVTDGTIYARIDRPASIISFCKPRDANEVLNSWSHDIKTLLGLVDKIDHLLP